MSDLDLDRIRELMDDPAVQRLAAEAPPLPEAAVGLLKAAGCPVRRRRKGTAA